MSFRSLCTFVAAVLLVTACTVSADKSVEEKARAFVGQLTKGQFAEAHAQFNLDMKKGLPLPMLESSWKALVAQIGAFKSVKYVAVRQTGKDIQTVIVRCAFELQELDVVVSFEASGKIAGLYFRPPS